MKRLYHLNHMAKIGFALISASTLVACASIEAPTRSDVLLDTGRALSPGLMAYDVDRYVLRHEILPEQKAIAGSATIELTAVQTMSELELDFDGNFNIERIETENTDLAYRQTAEKLFITLGQPVSAGETLAVTVHYNGQPMEAERAPWDGGFVWEKTPSGKPWIATAIQGEGCDVWWPCKDHPLGEPRNGAEMYFTVPAGLTVASNGVLQDVEEHEDGRKTFHWRTDVSTNIYNIALNVGPYVLLEDSYTSTNGTEIPVKFWAIEDREEKARILFEKEFPAILEFFERRLGPYPWGQEKMGVVETPHLGMEHQTINAYGNEYRRPQNGFDWLLHHEFAHEWFGNIMSVRNNADMWLHEGTAAYMGPVYTQEVMGDAARHTQMFQTYLGVQNCVAVAPRGEMSEDVVYNADKGGPGGDIYAKGAWVLHSLNYVIGEDAFWSSIRKLLYDTDQPAKLPAPIEARFRTTDDYLAIVNETTGKDMSWFFEVYLRSAAAPVLESSVEGNDLVLTWTTPNDLPFPMPVPVRVNGKMKRIEMQGGTGRIRGGAKAEIQIDPMMDIFRKLPNQPTCEERKAEASN
ncbi:MAG: peptidase M1 [Hyphococcus sp.]|nr:MAG: peptidase M1 [Marinicaulis sp.]